MSRLEASLLKYTHLQPSEMDRLPFWRVEELVETLHQLAEEEEEARKKGEKGDKANSTPNLNMSNYQRQISSAMNSKPQLPNFKF